MICITLRENVLAATIAAEAKAKAARIAVEIKAEAGRIAVEAKAEEYQSDECRETESEWHEYLKRIIEEPNIAHQLQAGFDQEAYVAAKVIGTQVLMDQDNLFDSFDDSKVVYTPPERIDGIVIIPDDDIFASIREKGIHRMRSLKYHSNNTAQVEYFAALIAILHPSDLLPICVLLWAVQCERGGLLLHEAAPAEEAFF
jgi:hypothetical protein